VNVLTTYSGTVHSSVLAIYGGVSPPIAKAVVLGVDAFPPAPVLNSPPTAKLFTSVQLVPFQASVLVGVGGPANTKEDV
jgi:hypothetical protein